MALTGDYSELDRNADARAAFDDWAGQFSHEADRATGVWRMSGLPDLLHAIYERIIWNSGRRHLDAITTELRNIRSEYEARRSLAASRNLAGRIARTDPMALRNQIGAVGRRATDQLDEAIARLSADLREKLHSVRDHYVTEATDDLVEHLRRHPGDHGWTYNSAALRMMFWSAHERFARQITAEVAWIYALAAQGLTELYPQALGLTLDRFRIEPPQVPEVAPPISLARTIAIDLGGRWWSRWFQRRREIANHARDYRTLIEAEIGSMIDDLEHGQLAELFGQMRSTLAGFLRDQQRTALDLVVDATAFRIDEAELASFPTVLEAALAALQGLPLPQAPDAGKAAALHPYTPEGAAG